MNEPDLSFSPELELRSTLLVYVVDDERIIASTLVAVLQLNGFAGRFFFSAFEALDAARAEKPDLLIADVMMPGLSGVDLAIRMKEVCPSCKVLLFSGRVETADVLQEAREHGHAFQLVKKPIRPADLFATIGKLMA